MSSRAHIFPLRIRVPVSEFFVYTHMRAAACVLACRCAHEHPGAVRLAQSERQRGSQIDCSNTGGRR